MHPQPLLWIVGVTGFILALTLGVLSVLRLRGRALRIRPRPVIAIAAIAVAALTALTVVGAEDQAILSDAFGGAPVTRPIWSVGCAAGVVAVMLAVVALVVAASNRARTASVH
jgi:hypothetical protein